MSVFEYEATLEAESGEPPYRWSAAGLPSGLTVDPATGTITGGPREAGTFSVNVTVTDSQMPARTSTRTLSLTVAVTSGCEDNTSIPDIECHALVEFAKGMPRVETWNVDIGRGGDPCGWFGVICRDGHVVELDGEPEAFYSMGGPDGGTLIPALRHLTELEYLNLMYVPFVGELPEELGQLKKLKTLALGYNSFDNINEADWLWELPELEGLYLPSLGLTEIPQGLSKLTKLRDLLLSGNDFTGGLPDWIGEMKDLRFLDISYSNLTGHLPETLGDLSNLEFLYLSYNQLEGEIPDSFAKLGNLVALNLNSNGLEGEIPAWLWELPKLSNIQLARNRFEGHIPDTIIRDPRYVLTRENGCLTGSEAVIEWLSPIDPRWQDGCPLQIVTEALPDGREDGESTSSRSKRPEADATTTAPTGGRSAPQDPTRQASTRNRRHPGAAVGRSKRRLAGDRHRHRRRRQHRLQDLRLAGASRAHHLAVNRIRPHLRHRLVGRRLVLG